MQRRHDVVKLSLAHNLAQILPLAFPQLKDLPTFPKEEELYDLLGEPPQREMGHYALPCFILSKLGKMPPAKIAEQIKTHWQQSSPLIEKVEVQGPYFNIFLNLGQVGREVIAKILDQSYFKTILTEQTPRTMIEYSQPNTHKELHVGHMRNLSLGHSLVLLLRYCGYDVVTSTFPGDVGTHVAKCLWYLRSHNLLPIPTKGKGAFLGHLYSLAEEKLQAEKGTPQEDKNRQELGEILSQLEKKQGEFYDLWQETRQWSIELMKEVYKWAQVDFDYWYWESDVDSASVKLVEDYYKKGMLVKSEGAIGMDLSEENLGFCLLIKSDGIGLYATKDLELARRKFQDHHIERSLYVVDVRQTRHFAQVFKVLEKLGFPHAKDCHHLSYDFVELPEGIMSSRKGNVVPIQSLIEQMVDLIKKDYLERYRGGQGPGAWTEEEIDQTASQVALGAIKYGMLKIDSQRKIVFDMKEWLKLDGDSGPYLQYVRARINSLQNKDKLQELSVTSIQPTWELLQHSSEQNLIYKLSQFNTVALNCCENYRPSTLSAYLYDLGKIFNYFYAECPILSAETKELRQTRFALAMAVGQVIEQGLKLLGIPSPQRM